MKSSVEATGVVLKNRSYASYADLAVASRLLADKTEELARNDAALDAWPQDKVMDSVRDKVQFAAQLELLREPEYRRRDGDAPDMGLDVALKLQRSALRVASEMGGHTAGAILARIGKDVLEAFPTPGTAHTMHGMVTCGEITDSERQILGSTLGMVVSQRDSKMCVVIDRTVFDHIIAGSAPNAETIRTIALEAAAPANAEQAKSILGEAIQAIATGHLDGDPEPSAFDGERITVTRAQKTAASAANVGPHYNPHGGSSKQWDGPVTLDWLLEKLQAIPSSSN